MIYDPDRFSSTFAAERGQEIWGFLTEPNNILRMETATYLSRPAIEPLSPFLLERFGEHVRQDRVKQMMGHMVRQIMEHNGYAFQQSNVKINTNDNIFSRAARYAVRQVS